MSTARQVTHTYQAYLAIERDSPVRHEFSSGEISARGGGTPEQAALIGQVMLRLGRLFPQCRVLPADLRVRISASDVTTYPDVSVVCGPLARADEDALAVTNPRVLVEVTSPSTEASDGDAKLGYWTESAWVSVEARGGADAAFEGVTLEVDELYAVLQGV